MNKTIVATVVLAASAALAPSMASAQAKYDVTQVVATRSFAFLPMYVAEQMGYYADEGVNLKTVHAASAQAGLAMVSSGDAAYYLSTPVAGARAAAQGAKMNNCGALMTQNPTNIVISQATAKKHNVSNPASMTLEQKMALLKGLRLAAHTPGSSPDLTLKYMLKTSGMDPERDVQILPITQDAILAAIERDRIDGFAYSSPLADQAVVKFGAVKLISLAAGDYKPLSGQLSITMVCNKDWVAQKPEAAAATLRALWRGMKLMKTEPAKAKAAARKAFADMDDATFNAAFETNLNAFPDNPRISREQMEAALDYHVKTGGAPIQVKPEETYTNAAVDLAARGMR